ncbi:MAG TPA: GIY-YIG nuclease family protein [Epulopiscium sp.]|nr:GIY-YIG nuclease family protein [Candidatus Epulonipiscium sp.]
MNYVYILECSDGTYYTGYTNDIKKRITAHNEGKGAKYTRGRSPVALKHVETYETKSEAMKREYSIKKLSRIEKQRLFTKQSSKLNI